MPLPILGYWDTRGIAERIRILLEHVGIQYENQIYKFGTAPDFKDNDWSVVKSSLEMEFPNLPYYIDGEVKISESMAIMKYVARKHGLVPDTIQGWARAEMVENIIRDLIIEFGNVCYSENFHDDRDIFFQNFPTKLENIDRHLSKNKWAADDKLTYVDFCVGEILDHVRLLKSDVYKGFANIEEYLVNYDNLDSVSSHRKTNTYRALPVNGPMSAWGGKSNNKV